MADSILQRPGNNPYCHHRTESLGRQGLRESLRQIEAAPGLSFDRGLFEIVVESEDGTAVDTVACDLTPRQSGVSDADLVVCHGCLRHVFAGTTTCPFCSADVEEARVRHEATIDDAYRAMETLRRYASALEPQTVLS